MRQLKRYLSDAPKPLLLQVGIVVLLVLPPLWWVQQNNVNALSQRIDQLEQQINNPKLAIAPKDRLALKKDLAGLEKDRVSLQNNIYTTLVQALGGAFFFVTAYLTWRNVKATEEKQITERFSKAVEMLGSDKIEVRLGGIYALERISKDSVKDYWTIIEILTGFVRERSRSRWEQEKPQLGGIKEATHPPTDIQAVLTVLKHRALSYGKGEEYRPNLRLADFSRLILPKSTLKEMDLWGANFQNSVLQESKLMGANLAEANLSNTNLNLADFSNATLAGANLSGAEMRGADLSGADLSGADLRGVALNGADLSGANLEGADLEGATLWNTILRGAKLGASRNLTGEQIKRTVIDQKTEIPAHLLQTRTSQSEPSQAELPNSKQP
ncbi:pentapeptide repeat-containing protein [Kovacikia minuta CCNUW1]|uniref:pentapeptide repeat-containing protein n=1 Tax=Kovacikia minuta TaxID=2931930 RepID=UPI001CCC8EE9|nr:pentapeptide repeat-containing protein [Kovacikia minuta]UBF27469.1 pentapeptide repeat-containing protein [Kovacikia minuta CCNUW1]